MDTTFFDQYQMQFSEWQKKFFDTWRESIPTGDQQVDLSYSYQKTLDLQQDAVKAALHAQVVAIQTVVEAQGRFWDNYFDLMRRSPMAKGDVKVEGKEAA